MRIFQRKQGRGSSLSSTLHFVTQGGLGDIRLTAEAVLVEPMGPNSLVLMRVGRNELKMRSTSPLAPGQPVTLSFNLHDMFFFDARTGLRLKSDKIY
jgi:hypothetical protein